MEFDRTTTGAAFVAVIAIGVVGMTFTPMTKSTILMMVLPTMVVYGLLMLWLGVRHGEHRAGAR
jgi:Sec-independent protein secretion pathway component TatC